MSCSACRDRLFGPVASWLLAPAWAGWRRRLRLRQKPDRANTPSFAVIGIMSSALATKPDPRAVAVTEPRASSADVLPRSQVMLNRKEKHDRRIFDAVTRSVKVNVHLAVVSTRSAEEPGTLAGFASEWVAGFRRNPHPPFGAGSRS